MNRKRNAPPKRPPRLRPFLRLIGLSLFFISMAPAQKQPATSPSQSSTRQAFRNDSGSFHFAILCDRAGGTRPGVFERAVEKINLMQPAFVLSIGDLIDGTAQNQTELEGQWDELDRIVSRLDARFFFTPGNHDVSKTPFSTEVWKKRRGPLYYHFVFQNTLFLCLNTDDGQANRISGEQVGYVRQALKDHRKVRWTFVLMHKPLWTFQQAEGWDSVEQLLQDRPHTVFTGHTHEYKRYERSGHEYIVFSTTGGGWSQERKTNEFDQIGWVSMTKDNPRVVVLKLDCMELGQ